MHISFIITAYNIDFYIEKCMRSVASVARPGDQVIIIDDGSTDETVSVIKTTIENQTFNDGVELNTIFFGVNTKGGVGTAANIGILTANRECIFFVDGDDWLDTSGFNFAREQFKQKSPDILISNYREYDDQRKILLHPADEKRWLHRRKTEDTTKTLLQALQLIAVPWRKFYNTKFLKNKNIRFAEGDFFFEDNPFHWEVCTNANDIEFYDTIICYHRVNRPGQTMASSGHELIAFLDHYVTIRDKLPSTAPKEIMIQLISWLLGNISWHIERLNETAVHHYVRRTSEILEGIDQTLLYEAIARDFTNTRVATFVSTLAELGWPATVNTLLLERAQNKILALEKKLNEEIQSVRSEILEQVDETFTAVQVLRTISEYEAISSFSRAAT